jgi:5'-deoxynucleotidase YfbR-like HD superfamily hydrolase
MKIYTSVMNLSNIKRFGTSHMVQPYNVAEHSYRVAMMAMIMVDNYNNENPLDKINAEEVMRKALIHDLEEGKIGDIGTPIKKKRELRNLLREISVEVLEGDVLDKNLAEREMYLDLWKKDKDGASGQVIEICDKLEALYVAAHEINKGNRELNEAFHNLRSWFNEFKAQVLLNKFSMARQILSDIDESVKRLDITEMKMFAKIK